MNVVANNEHPYRAVFVFVRTTTRTILDNVRVRGNVRFCVGPAVVACAGYLATEKAAGKRAVQARHLVNERRAQICFAVAPAAMALITEVFQSLPSISCHGMIFRTLAQ